MTNPSDVHGRRLAMVVWSEKSDGSDDVVVLARTAHWDGQHLSMVRDSGEVLMTLQEEWLERLQPVAESVKKTLLDADFSFSVTIGPLPEGADMTEFVKTGFRWPVDD